MIVCTRDWLFQKNLFTGLGLVILTLISVCQQGMAVDDEQSKQVLSTELAELVETRKQVPSLSPAKAFVVIDNVVTLELSEYAGYAGLIVANNGLEPNDDSYFTKNHGFKLKLSLSEEESWSKLNSGGLAGSATTVDVLAAYGSQFKVVVPALIGFSRGSTALVVRKDVHTINDLQGKIVSTAQFTEADFLIRYLSREASLEIGFLDEPPWKPAVDKINLVFCDEGFASGDMFARDVIKNLSRFGGCVTWDPKTTEVTEKCNGGAVVLATTANLLVVADILVLNEGFAKANPKIVLGLVDGLLAGNEMVREDPDKHFVILEKVFEWEKGDAAEELKKVHLANLPENLAFFNGTIDSAGSFEYILETAIDIYKSQIIGKPIKCESVLSLDALKAAEKSGVYKNQKSKIEPVLVDAIGETDPAPLLSKNVTIEFQPNKATVIDDDKNQEAFKTIAALLKIGNGSTVMLRGHADSEKLDAFRKRADFKDAGGEGKVREGKLKLKALSKERSLASKEVLVKQYNISAGRIECEGVGIDEPTGGGPARDRRVEIQWFTK